MDLFSGHWKGKLVAGVDEVGRGPLAGDVVAAAVILDPERSVEGLRDSKKLSSTRREVLAGLIRTNALCYSIARATVAEIDQLNILHASMLAMKRAVEGLAIQPEFVFVDGNRLPRWGYAAEAVVGGDDKVEEIAAASILAKVCRDDEMIALDKSFPGYGLARHKGYPTREHLAALRTLGASPLHRQTFAPVRKVIESVSPMRED